jgi:AcrR family transcriptional regulator
MARRGTGSRKGAERPGPRARRADTPVATRRGRLPSRQERANERRQAILVAALEEFSQAGFAAARLDDVAKRAGVAKGTIYLYFRDKETLFQEIVRDMLAPVVGSIEALGKADVPMLDLAERLVALFVHEIYETRRRDVIRLILTEGRRFPHLAEFYYREVLARVLKAVRVVLRRAAERGQAPPGLIDFPQLIAAPGLIAVMWSGLFDRFEPLDVPAMLRTHIELLFGSRRAP